MSANVTILTEMEALYFLHWKFRSGHFIIGVGGQEDLKLTTCPVQLKDLDSNKEAIHPVISKVPRNLRGRDILEDIGAVLTADDRVFFDNIQVHKKIGLAN